MVETLKALLDAYTKGKEPNITLHNRTLLEILLLEKTLLDFEQELKDIGKGIES